jgi:hypothetical protein
MFSLIVQGAHANSFAFKQHSGFEFKSFVENLTLSNVTLISSRYRIDLIGSSSEDRMEDIMRAWCRITGRDFNSTNKRKFIRSKGRKEAMENYFTSLLYLLRMPDWFMEYAEELNKVISQQPDHPIHKELINCAQFLAGRNNLVDLAITQSEEKAETKYLLQNLHQFATNSASGFLKN